jgi:hypothetical protein
VPGSSATQETLLGDYFSESLKEKISLATLQVINLGFLYHKNDRISSQIYHLHEGRDLLGSGRKLAFLIPVVKLILKLSRNGTGAVIIFI